MVTAVTDKVEITRCQKQLEHALKKRLKKSETLVIGHQGGNFEAKVFHEPGLWYTYPETDSEIPRHWNAFGLEMKDQGSQSITVEINPPFKGYEARVSGLFARDESGEYVLLHRGRVGGGGKGIGKRAFRDWSRSPWLDVAGADGARDEAILVTPLRSPRIVDLVKAFVEEVATFKREVKSGTLSRRPSKTVKTFNPEFHGKKKGHRAGALEYESFHGLVVNALEDKVKAPIQSSIDKGRARVFNTQQMDLAVEIDGGLRRLYEIKSSAVPQSLYAGTGQLFIHALQGVRVAKTLVLPSDGISERIRTLMSALNIEILGYRIKGGKVTFAS